MEHVKSVSQRVKQASAQPCQERGLPVEFLRNPATNKDAMARQLAADRKLANGLVCALSTVEPSPSFKHRGTQMVRRMGACQVIYQYQHHPKMGWMYARLQTWFPFRIQVGINGREWLPRRMDRARVKYRQQGNCFVWIEDWLAAQNSHGPAVED